MVRAKAWSAEGTLSSEPLDDWASLVRSFTYYQEAAGRSSATIHLYSRTLLRNYFPWLIDRGLNVRGAQAEHLREYIVDLKRSGKSEATQSIYRQGVRMFYAFLHQEGEINVDPFKAGRVPEPKITPKAKKVITLAEFERLSKACKAFDYLETRERTLITLLFETGLRAAELCNLNVSDLNLDSCQITVRRGKGGSPRVIGFGPKCRQQLDRYLRWRAKRLGEPDPGYLFISRDGTRLSTHSLNGIVHKVGLEAGMPGIHTHLFRHSAATLMAEHGMQDSDLRFQMGWKPGSIMAYHYTQSTAAERARQAQRRFSPLG